MKKNTSNVAAKLPRKSASKLPPKKLVPVAAKKPKVPVKMRSNKVPQSTTADLLPNFSRSTRSAGVPIPTKWRTQYAALKSLRASLLEESGSLAKAAAEQLPNDSMHMAEAGTDSFDRDFALGLLSSKQGSVNEIDQAMRRIETGGYGICELTGKPIPAKRLAVIPWTRYTAAAQEQLERDGAATSAQLGKLEALEGVEEVMAEEAEETEGNDGGDRRNANLKQE